MSANVFISFASQDKKVATTLCAALESRGFSCWISSRDIKPGENFQIAIVRAIRNAKMMLLVFTANSNASDEMSKELALASQQKLIVVPLRVEDVAPNEAFAYEFATRQWIDFFADWEAAINQLCVRLAQAMPPEEETPAAPVAAAPPPLAAPEPVAEARPTPAVKAPAPEPAPPPPKAEPVAAAPPKPPEPKPPAAPEVKPPEAKVAPPARAPEVKPVQAAPSKPPPAVKTPPAAGDAAPARKSPVALFVGIGVAAVLIVGAVVALPMLTGKKPAAQASASPSAAAPSAAPAASSVASAPASGAPAVTTVAAGGAEPSTADSGSPAASSVAAAAPKPRVRKHAPAHAAVKADVPY